MKKIIAFLISFSLFLPVTEAFAITKTEAQTIDLTAESDLSSEKLRAGLLGELVFLADEFVAAEEKYGVNSLFLAAVAALESGWGKSCFRENNIFGWSGKSFDSKEDCIDFVASKIAENYLSEDGKYYNGKTLSGVNTCYNGNLFWEEKVAGIMAMISRKCEEKTFFPQTNFTLG